ncbi:MAG: hypothetical protein ACRDNX_11580, partial [Gaiellaceae bacterium]
LRIYLNDHRAGSVIGLELAKRALASNRGNDYGRVLEDLIGEIEADRETLDGLMEMLDIPRNRPKQVVGWVAEKLGRLKLNGQIRGYSPLSRLEELEGLSLGVEGKKAMWLSLQRVAGSDPRLSTFDFDALVERAGAQRESLEELRRRATEQALAAG